MTVISKDPAAPASNSEDLAALLFKWFNSDWVEERRRDACGLNMTRTTVWCFVSGVVTLIRMSTGTSLSKGAGSTKIHKYLYNFGVIEFVFKQKKTVLAVVIKNFCWVLNIEVRGNHWQPVNFTHWFTNSKWMQQACKCPCKVHRDILHWVTEC